MKANDQARNETDRVQGRHGPLPRMRELRSAVPVLWQVFVSLLPVSRNTKEAMSRQLIIELTGFDAHGVFVGSATYTLGKGWLMHIPPAKGRYYIPSEHGARWALAEAGATTVRESDGGKR